MTATVCEWLPPEALAHPIFAGRLRAEVAAWSAHWFALRRVEVFDLAPSGELRAADDELSGPSSGVGVVEAHRAAWLAGLAALGLDPGARELTRRDQALLRSLGDRILADLTARLASAFGATATSLPDGGALRAGVVATLALDDGAPLLRLSLPAQFVAPFVKAQLVQALAPPPRPQSRLAALGDSTVTLEARLGEAEVSLDDLNEIAPGDVLVLDRAVADGVLVVIEGGGAPVGRARMTELDGHIALSFEGRVG